ncbi:PIR Superfamily Protein [Plasmodium ovale curtisi]|uniref:PIR Superfamily Protein n=1 Tax=Plasmodium ovale curtisi TaxID=864141 RepID=A0A1A8X553_PLAOA|nr:PIR Superfamily Protein [Plasmodium ovale curtisi]SBS98888.1 PIR Superfamily Protein [Plasmodium ovale curtisi]
MATEEDPDLKVLHTNVVYYKLDTASKDYKQDSDAFWNTAIAEHYMKTLRIFPTLAKGLYYVSKMDNYDAHYDERWNYLYFWAGLKMIENSESFQSFSFSDLMSLLKLVRNFIQKDSGSYTDDMLKMNKDNFKDLKDVYDYLENYKSIELKIDSSGNSPCTARYKDYVTEAHELYKREKEKCQGNNKDEYCRILNSFLLKHEKTFITQRKCTGTKPVKPHSEEEDPQDTMDSESSGVHREERGQGSQTLFSPFRDSGQTRGIPHPGGDVSPSSRSTNAISTVFPLLGTASLTFFFLKFTPLGSSLYNRIFSKQIIRSNEEEEAQEILGNTYEIPHTNIDDTAHHIAYHSM